MGYIFGQLLSGWPPIPKVIIIVTISAVTAIRLPSYYTLLSSRFGHFGPYLPPRSASVAFLQPHQQTVAASVLISLPFALQPNTTKPSSSLGQGILLEALLYNVSRSHAHSLGGARKETRKIQQLAAGRRSEHVRGHYAWSTAGGRQNYDGCKQDG